jgi:hypothetical protein
MAIRVVLADDHVLMRQGLKSLLEREGFQVVAEASDGQEARYRRNGYQHAHLEWAECCTGNKSFFSEDQNHSAYAT